MLTDQTGLIYHVAEVVCTSGPSEFYSYSYVPPYYNCDITFQVSIVLTPLPSLQSTYFIFSICFGFGLLFYNLLHLFISREVGGTGGEDHKKQVKSQRQVWRAFSGERPLGKESRVERCSTVEGKASIKHNYTQIKMP